MQNQNQSRKDTALLKVRKRSQVPMFSNEGINTQPCYPLMDSTDIDQWEVDTKQQTTSTINLNIMKKEQDNLIPF